MREICSECCSYNGPNVRCGLGLCPTADDDHCANWDWKPGVKWSPQLSGGSEKQSVKVFDNKGYSNVREEHDMRASIQDKEIEIKEDSRYLLSINSKAWAKMFYFTQYAKGEVDGYFKVRRKDDYEFVVTDVIILDQVSSAGHTQIDEEAHIAFISKLGASETEKIEDWCGWWHSHGNGDVFWSPEDENTCRVEHDNGNFMVSIVTNKDSQILARIDVFKPVAVVIQPLVRIVPTGHARLGEGCLRQVLRKVKEHGQQQVS